jgi:hypothetical protein
MHIPVLIVHFSDNANTCFYIFWYKDFSPLEAQEAAIACMEIALRSKNLALVPLKILMERSSQR